MKWGLQRMNGKTEKLEKEALVLGSQKTCKKLESFFSRKEIKK